MDLSPGGAFLAWTVNEAGYSRLYLRDLRAGSRVQVPSMPDGVVTLPRFSHDGTRLGFYLERPRHIDELHVLAQGSSEIEITRLTFSMIGGVPEDDMVPPEAIEIPDGTGGQIPAFLYRPPRASAQEPVPAVLSIHGGPEEQERPTYAHGGLYQYLVNRGIAVLAPNIRGSTGYGKAYGSTPPPGGTGAAACRDLRASADYLRSLQWVDRTRLGVYGRGYGGFAALTAATRLADYWRAAVDIFGPSNLVAFTRSVPPFWKRYIARWVGDPRRKATGSRPRHPSPTSTACVARSLSFRAPTTPACPEVTATRSWSDFDRWGGRWSTSSSTTRATDSRDARTSAARSRRRPLFWSAT